MRAATFSFLFLAISTFNICACYVMDKPPSPHLLAWAIVAFVTSGIITAMDLIRST
jgi:hypothetical protein